MQSGLACSGAMRRAAVTPIFHNDFGVFVPPSAAVVGPLAKQVQPLEHGNKNVYLAANKGGNFNHYNQRLAGGSLLGRSRLQNYNLHLWTERDGLATKLCYHSV